MSTGTEKLLNGLAAAFNDGIHWDFVVQVGNVEFKISKLIVGIHSEVFERIFAADMREAEENRVVIKDFSPQAIEHLLRFCYATPIAALDSPMLLEVFRAAHCYQMPDLMSECKRQAMATKSVENALEWLAIGFGYEDEQLKHEFLEFFLQHDEEIQALPEFAAFIHEHSLIAAELLRRMSAERKSQKAAVQKLQAANQQLKEANERLSIPVVHLAIRPAPPRQVAAQALYRDWSRRDPYDSDY
ncbi:CRE-BATH-40 protein [Aphelenchoides fujianensis]|nr:CRE-BATH-40 protein [Aphelenchoides fujianensis]